MHKIRNSLKWLINFLDEIVFKNMIILDLSLFVLGGLFYYICTYFGMCMLGIVTFSVLMIFLAYVIQRVIFARTRDVNTALLKNLYFLSLVFLLVSFMYIIIDLYATNNSVRSVISFIIVGVIFNWVIIVVFTSISQINEYNRTPFKYKKTVMEKMKMTNRVLIATITIAGAVLVFGKYYLEDLDKKRSETTKILTNIEKIKVYSEMIEKIESKELKNELVNLFWRYKSNAFALEVVLTWRFYNMSGSDPDPLKIFEEIRDMVVLWDGFYRRLEVWKQMEDKIYYSLQEQISQDIVNNRLSKEDIIKFKKMSKGSNVRKFVETIEGIDEEQISVPKPLPEKKKITGWIWLGGINDGYVWDSLRPTVRFVDDVKFGQSFKEKLKGKEAIVNYGVKLRNDYPKGQGLGEIVNILGPNQKIKIVEFQVSPRSKKMPPYDVWAKVELID